MDALPLHHQGSHLAKHFWKRHSQNATTWGWYHGGQPLSSDGPLHHQGSHLAKHFRKRHSQNAATCGWYHGGRRLSSDDSLPSPTVTPPSALDKPSITKRYHHQQTCSHTSPCRLPTMVTLYDTQFVVCRWWNDDWTVKTVVT